MDTVIAVRLRKPPGSQAPGSGATPQGPPTRLGPQPAPQQAPQTPASQVKRSAQRTYTEEEVASMLAEARGGREAVQVDPLEARRQALLRELGNVQRQQAARAPTGDIRSHLTLPAGTVIPAMIMPRTIPKMKAKPKMAPLTGSIPRRTSILPAFTRLRRAELETLAMQWGIDCNGRTMATIQDLLFELDAQLVQDVVRQRGGQQ